MVGIRSRFRYFHHYLCSSKRRRRCERPRGHQLKNTSIALLLSLSFVLSSSSSSSSVVLLFISIRMMWTMKFSRETRERVSDFILGQITYMWFYLIQRFFVLSCVAFINSFLSPTMHTKKKLGKKTIMHGLKKTVWEKKSSSVRKSRHVERVISLVKLN